MQHEIEQTPPCNSRGGRGLAGQPGLNHAAKCNETQHESRKRPRRSRAQAPQRQTTPVGPPPRHIAKRTQFPAVAHGASTLCPEHATTSKTSAKLGNFNKIR